MTYLGLLTELQKADLTGQLYAPNSYFNPIQDINDDWVISLQEIEQCDMEWVKQLPIIEYIPKELNLNI